MTTNNCCEKIDCTPPRILSKEATNEILGENLCLLIAIGKNGESVRFLPYSVPYSVQETPTELNVFDEETTTLIEISILVPKKPDIPYENTLLMDTKSSQRCVSTLALCLCKQAGKPPRQC